MIEVKYRKYLNWWFRKKYSTTAINEIMKLNKKRYEKFWNLQTWWKQKVCFIFWLLFSLFSFLIDDAIRDNMMQITYALVYFVHLSEFGKSKRTGTDFSIQNWFHLLSDIIIIDIDRNGQHFICCTTFLF